VQIKALAAAASDCADRTYLYRLASAEGKTEFHEHISTEQRTVLELLQAFGIKRM
jgi:hypothetical protein